MPVFTDNLKRYLFPTARRFPESTRCELELPFVFVYETPSRPTRSASMRFGLVAAMWDDGKVVRAISKKDVGSEYIRGYMTKNQLERINCLICYGGLLTSKPRRHLIVDGAATHIGLVSKGKMLVWSNSPDLESEPKLAIVEKRLLQESLTNTSAVDAGAHKLVHFDWFNALGVKP